MTNASSMVPGGGGITVTAGFVVVRVVVTEAATAFLATATGGGGMTRGLATVFLAVDVVGWTAVLLPALLLCFLAVGRGTAGKSGTGTARSSS